ncbi:MAG: stage V sporulation protein R [Bradymonadia bacterium]|jgi:stage V sporulation protein R
MSLTPELQESREEIEGHARAYGLDFFQTIFEVVDYDRISEIAAYGGFPTRYPHWRWGMEYDQLSKSTEYGLSKIYEMVINTDPAYAYLLEGNRMVDQRTVMAHVFGHVDFFANNYYFSKTNRKMVDQMANHATRVRRLIDRLGVEKVEKFIDTCLSLDNLIDHQSPFIERPGTTDDSLPESERDIAVHKLPASAYMDEFINPPAVLAEERAQKLREMEERKARFPVNPQRDVLAFLMEFAPLEGWELEILQIIRDEAYYFAPQGMTKIMNEGWASYWHSRILCEKVLKASEIIDYAEAMSGVLATSPKRLNPYKLGIELWRDVARRWDRGMFGREWEDCQDLDVKESWNTEAGEGQSKIFQARKLYNDITFVDEFLTPDFVERNGMYTFGYNKRAKRWEISSKQFDDIKRQLLDSLTNFGQPFVAVKDANFRNRGELLLEHRFLGTELHGDYAREVMRNLHRIWKRPVHIYTVVEEKGRLLGFDGTDHSDESWDSLTVQETE